jgi:hypothetical protein
LIVGIGKEFAERTGRVVGGRKLKSRPGITLLMTMAIVVSLLLLAYGGVFIFDSWLKTIEIRTARVQRVGTAMTEVILHQMHLYSIRLHQYYRVKTAEAKEAAFERWFSKAELEAKSTYTYEEIKEKFGTVMFDSVDRALTGLAQIKRFEVSIPLEDRTYDENDFLIVCKVLVEIEMEEGAKVNAISKIHRKPQGVGSISRGNRAAVTEIWSKNGTAITIPIQIEASGKNFWVDDWVDGLPTSADILGLP